MYILVLDIFCQQLGDLCQLEGVELQNMIFFKKIHIPVNAHSAALRPMGAQTPHNSHISPNCWQNISITGIYLPIVGRIYPIPEYICQLLAEYIQYQNISPIVGRIYLIPEYIQYQCTYIFNYSYIPQLLAVYIQ